MTDTTPLDRFEHRLAGLLRTDSDSVVGPFDALDIARAAIATRAQHRELPLGWPASVDRRILEVLIAAAVVIALSILAVAAPLVTHHRQEPGRLVFIREGDVFLADIDGSGQTRIAPGGADRSRFGYMAALWSPDGRHIAAVRDTGGPTLTPALDVLNTDGSIARTVELGPGGVPSIAWSPDGSEVAVVVNPADIARDAEPVNGTAMRLLIRGLAATADREIPLPPEVLGWAVTAIGPRSGLGVRWSPDGRWLMLRSESGLRLVAADGSATRRVEELTDVLGDWIAYLDWLPDGRRAVVAGSWLGCIESVCLGLLDPEGKEPLATVAQHPPSGQPDTHDKLIWPVVSPDGKRVAADWNSIEVSSGLESVTLLAYDLDTGGQLPLVSGTIGAGTLGRREVLSGEVAGLGTHAWTLDGRRLVYLMREPGEDTRWTIRSVDAAGGQPVTLVEGVQAFDIGRD
jgi:dipeptidyl aminopeptidase/acylaminoacyl peptidase